MKKLILLSLLFLSGALFAKQKINVSPLKPEQRKIFAENWLETGKTYFALNKRKNAKACYLFTIEVYPMGAAAEEARRLLKTDFSKKIIYNSEQTYSNYLKLAEKSTNKNFKLSNLEMAQVIRKDADILYRIAVLQLALGNQDAAAASLNKALKMGYPAEKVEANLKAVLKIN